MTRLAPLQKWSRLYCGKKLASRYTLRYERRFPIEYLSCKTAGVRHSIVVTMRWSLAGVVFLVAAVCLAADTPLMPPSLCSNSKGAPACQGSAKDLKAARQAFARGLRLENLQKQS